MTFSRGKKCALTALIVLAVGTGMLFRRSPTSPAPVDGEARKTVTRRLSSPRGASERGQLLRSFEEKLPRVPTAATTADPDTRSREFAAHPSRTFHPGGALFTSTDNGPPAEPPRDELLADARNPTTALEPAAGRTHLVVDGDTLAKLAARYLGSSDRYGEIFAANRSLLATPDLLPIGAQLVIPPRQRPAPPVEIGPEDNPGTSQPQEDRLPRLDIEPLPAVGTERPASRQADQTDDHALVPVSKALPGEKE